jgi:hypothetical protein
VFGTVVTFGALLPRPAGDRKNGMEGELRPRDDRATYRSRSVAGALSPASNGGATTRGETARGGHK